MKSFSFLVISLVVSLLSTLCLGGCGSNPPKPVLPDGSHRAPVNAGSPPIKPVPLGSTGARS